MTNEQIELEITNETNITLSKSTRKVISACMAAHYVGIQEVRVKKDYASDKPNLLNIFDAETGMFLFSIDIEWDTILYLNTANH